MLLGTPLETAVAILTVDASTVDSTTAEGDAPPGDAPIPRALQSTVGLVWRALLLRMFLLVLFVGRDLVRLIACNGALARSWERWRGLVSLHFQEGRVGLI